VKEEIQPTGDGARSERQERGRWWGAEFCPHPGKPCIDGCYYCGRPVGALDGNHNHTMTEKADSPLEDRYSCVCESC